MICYILFLISVCLLVLCYIYVFFKLLINNKNIDDKTSFDVAKEITDNYDSINIVSSSDVIFSEYDIKRNVIRLSDKVYDSNRVRNIVSSSMLAGYSLVNQENNSYFKFSFVIRKLRVFSIVGLVGIVLSYFINNIGDAYIGLVIFFMMLIYQYMRYQISVLSNDLIMEVLDEKIYKKISSGISSVILFDKVSFIIMLILIIRLVVIIIGM